VFPCPYYALRSLSAEIVDNGATEPASGYGALC